MAGKVVSMPVATENIDVPFQVSFLTLDMNDSAVRSVSLADGLELVFVRPIGRVSTESDARLPHPLPHPHSHSHARVRLFEKSALPSESGLTIEEHSGSGTVPSLVARNTSTFDYLLIAGQMIQGGKQNRGFNADMLITAGSTVKIPVTCVQQGRWSSGATERFQACGFEPTSVRTSKMRTVCDSVRANRGHSADQQAVWSEINSMQAAVGASSRSADLCETLLHLSRTRESVTAERSASRGPQAPRERGLDDETEYLFREVEALRERLVAAQAAGSHDEEGATMAHFNASRELYRRRQLARQEREDSHRARVDPRHRVSPEGQARADEAARGACGMLVFFQGEFLSGDVFADEQWFAALYGGLRNSALMAWDVAVERCMRTNRPFARKECDASDAQTRAILNDASQGVWKQRAAVAQGRSLFLEHPTLESSLLADDQGMPLHCILSTNRMPEVLQPHR